MSVAAPHLGAFGRQEIKKRLPFFVLKLGLHVRNDADLRDAVLRQLRSHVEGADSFHLVAEELQAVGHLVGVRKYIHDPAPDGELARLIDEVGFLKIVVDQQFANKLGVQALTSADEESVLLKGLLVNHLLGERIRVGDDQVLVGRRV